LLINCGFLFPSKFIDMKIRIKGNSIRLRLTQSEVQQFEKEGIVTESIQLGITEKERLNYKLQKSDGKEISAKLSENTLSVYIPDGMGNNWANTNLVGLSTEMPLEKDAFLSILVEKDFKCLTDRLGEDESDNFPNPLDKHPDC